MPANNNELEKKLWDAADELRANSKLKSSEYSMPVLGLVFLKWADFKFAHAQRESEEEAKKSSTRRRRQIGKVDYQARGIIYVSDKARYSYLMNLPESADIGRAINDAMELFEVENEDLRGVLPKNYQNFESRVLLSLLRIFNTIPMDVEGDAFGKIYEYFLGKFAMAEGQKAGEFFTPTSIVKLIVEILEPFHGRIYDPACGSGGMFVQSARFVKEHQKNPSEEISIYGQERVSETVKLCKMNLAVHGLAGDIKEGNTYYEDIHRSIAKFDFVMANPPFNVDKVDHDRIKNDSRFSLGMPTIDNANFVWIQVFSSALAGNGQAGFVMANSACDARGSELAIRRKLIESRVVDAMVSVGPKFFYTVGLPCTLWFLDEGKAETSRANRVLFIDARAIYEQTDRAHREFSSKQIEFMANTVRLYRDEPLHFKSLSKKERIADGISSWSEVFPNDDYEDVPGYCAVRSLKDIMGQAWSLNPGRYVIVPEHDRQEDDFRSKLQVSIDEFKTLSKEANQLVSRIETSASSLLRDDS